MQQFYRFLGFDSTHLDKPGRYMLTEKGAGMIRYDDGDINDSHNRNDSYESFPNELIADIIANLKGGYDSESGLDELIHLIKGFIDVSQRKAVKKYLNEEQIMHALIPASVNATGAELESYKIKMNDVKYFIHRLQRYDTELTE
jgi:hypothetical protein